MKSINPYLNFNGNCEEAFNFYKSVFGGEFIGIMRFKDVPDEGHNIAEHEMDKVMHMSLPMGSNILMGSDAPGFMGKVDFGNNFSISISADSAEETEKIFNKLSEGGKITMPLQNMFWGSYFGMCKDKFGVDWMVSFDTGNNASAS